MKTFVTQTHDIQQSKPTKKPYQNSDFHRDDDHGEHNLNKNATVAELEYQRDACEEELYRLRYGIEQLLASNDQSDFREQQQQRHRQMPNPMRSMSNRVNDFNDQNDAEECSPCCRRYKGHRQDHSVNSVHDYTPRSISQDRNYDLISQRASEHSPRSPLYSDSFLSTSSSPSIVSHNIRPTSSHTRSNTRSNTDSFTRQRSSNNIDFSELFSSIDMNDPVLKSLILRILEAKALDCLCPGYSKENTERQISDALFELNQRVDQAKWDSPSTSSSRSTLSSYEPSIASPSSSVKLSEKKKPIGSSEKSTLSVPKARMKSSQSKSKRKSSKHGKKRSTSSRSHSKPSKSSRSRKKPSTSSRSHKKPSRSSRSRKKSSKSRSKKKKKSSKR